MIFYVLLLVPVIGKSYLLRPDYGIRFPFNLNIIKRAEGFRVGQGLMSS